MSARFSSSLATVALISSLILFSLACGGSDPVPDESVAEAPEAEQQSQRVVMYQYRFNPTSLEVSSGTEVIFQNRDPEPHNINIPALDVDQNIEPNQEWSYTFDTAGEFAVGNRFSDGMRLDVTVD